MTAPVVQEGEISVSDARSWGATEFCYLLEHEPLAIRTAPVDSTRGRPVLDQFLIIVGENVL